MGLHPVTAAVAIGSNLEPRFDALQHAVNQLASHPSVASLRVARVYIAKPVPVPGVDGPLGSDYLNTAVTFQTALKPVPLLALLKSIEKSLGRDQLLHPHGGPRPIDLDLLLLGQHQLQNPSLTLPHPRMAERLFVLQPLCDLIPFARIPGDGRTIRQACEAQLLAPNASLLPVYAQSLTISP